MENIRSGHQFIWHQQVRKNTKEKAIQITMPFVYVHFNWPVFPNRFRDNWSLNVPLLEIERRFLRGRLNENVGQSRKRKTAIREFFDWLWKVPIHSPRERALPLLFYITTSECGIGGPQKPRDFWIWNSTKRLSGKILSPV